MKDKILLIILSSLLISSCSSNKYKHPKVEELEELLGVHVILGKRFRGLSKEVSFKEVKDSARIADYIDMFIEEYQKYPPSYFNRIKVNKLILCDSLMKGDRRSIAVPYLRKGALLFAIDYPIHTDRRKWYFVHVMHHELHHSTDFYLYKGDVNMFRKSEEWAALNEKKFEYGEGGEVAYRKESKSIDWYHLSHPAKGFVNRYSMLGQEEDRAELVGLIMGNKKRRDTLIEYCKTDEILKRKVLYVINELNTLVKSKSNYWNDAMSNL